MSYLDRLWVKIVVTIWTTKIDWEQRSDAGNWHEKLISDTFIPSKNAANERNWQLAPLGILQKTKTFARFRGRIQFSGKVIITQQTRGFYRLIVVDQRGPQSTINVGSGAPARRRRASEAPFFRKFGKPIKPRKFGYDVTVRASEWTPSVQTLGEGAGRLNINLTGELNNAIFSCRRGIKKRKTHFCLLCQHTIAEVDRTFSRLSLTAAKRWRKRQTEGLNRKKGQRRSEDREKERAKAS